MYLFSTQFPNSSKCITPQNDGICSPHPPVIDCLAEVGRLDLLSSIEVRNSPSHKKNTLPNGGVNPQFGNGCLQQVAADCVQVKALVVGLGLDLFPHVRQGGPWSSHLSFQRAHHLDSDVRQRQSKKVPFDLTHRAAARCVSKGSISTRARASLKCSCQPKLQGYGTHHRLAAVRRSN